MLKEPSSSRHRRHADALEAGDEELECWPIATQQGHAFEVNNALPHQVWLNNGKSVM
jgi:hypothetical protein